MPEDLLSVSLELNLRTGDEDISIIELPLGLAERPVVVIAPILDEFTPDVLAFDVDATGFDDAHSLGVILKIIGDALTKSAEDALTRELQAAGPDEFPEGYYRHLARERLAGRDTDPTVPDA